VLTVDPVDKVAVTLRGRRSAVQKVMAEGLAPIEIDLTGRQPGPLHFTSDMIQVPRGLSVESIQPPQIDTSWEDRVVKVVPIVPRLAGRPAPGHRVVRVSATPREATVTGPRSVVEGLHEVELREVRVDGREETAELTAPVQIQRKYVKVRPESARVLVEVSGETVTRRFSLVPVELSGTPDGMQVELTPRTAQQVVLEGPPRVMAKLDRSDLRVVVDLGSLGRLRPGNYERPGRVEKLPKGARLLATVPALFGVVVRPRAPDRHED
jgi:YbbR domain-containing protein